MSCSHCHMNCACAANEAIADLQQQLAERDATIERQGKLMDEIVRRKKTYMADRNAFTGSTVLLGIDAIAAERESGE